MKQNETKILLTGSTGFLGKHLLESLLYKNYVIYITYRTKKKLSRLKKILNSYQKTLFVINIIDENIEDYFKKVNFNCIIHCATNYGRSDFCITDILKSNLLFPLNLLVLSKKYKVQSFINTDTILDKGINEYSLSKSQFYDWLTFFKEDISIANIRLEHFYGPNDDPSKFVTFMIRSLLKSKVSIALSPGQQKRDFIYIDDVISAFNLIIEHTINENIGLKNYDVATGDKISLMEFVKNLKILTNNKTSVLNFGELSYRPKEIMDINLNLKPIFNLGWKPKYTLVQGLCETIKKEKEKT